MLMLELFPLNFFIAIKRCCYDSPLAVSPDTPPSSNLRTAHLLCFFIVSLPQSLLPRHPPFTRLFREPRAVIPQQQNRLFVSNVVVHRRQSLVKRNLLVGEVKKLGGRQMTDETDQKRQTIQRMI